MSTSTRRRINFFFPFPCLYAYAWFCAETSENEISFRHKTSTRIFTIRGYVWPVKTLDPDYLAPYSSRVVMFGWFCLCQCLHRISFSLRSSLLLAVVFVASENYASAFACQIIENPSCTWLFPLDVVWFRRLTIVEKWWQALGFFLDSRALHKVLFS